MPIECPMSKVAYSKAVVTLRRGYDNSCDLGGQMPTCQLQEAPLRF